MIFNLFILIFFGYTAGNINIPTWDEAVAETDTDVTDESIAELLSQMETEDETDLEIESDWEEMESEETRENQYDLEDESGIAKIISEVNMDDQNYLENSTGTTRHDRNITLETSTNEGTSLETMTRTEEIMSKVSTNQNCLENLARFESSTISLIEERTSKIDKNNTTKLKMSTGIEESVSDVTIIGDQNNTEPATGIAIRPIGEILSEIITKYDTDLGTSTEIGEMISEVTIRDQTTLETATDITIWPVLLQMSANESTNFEIGSDIGEIVSEVATGDRNNLADTDVGEIVLEEITDDPIDLETATEMTTGDPNNLEIASSSTIWPVPLQMNTKENINFETQTGVSEVTTDDRNNFETLAGFEEIKSEITTGDQNYLENITSIEEIVLEVTSGDQNSTETRPISPVNMKNSTNSSTSTEIGQIISEITTGNGNNLENATGIEEIITEMISSDQSNLKANTSIEEMVSEATRCDENNTETITGQTIRPIGKLLSEMNTKTPINLETSTGIREIIPEVTMHVQNNLETVTGMTILPVLSQMNSNEGANFETATDTEEILFEVTNENQNDLGNATSIEEISSEITTFGENNLEIATGIEAIVSEMTTGDTGNLDADIGVGKIVSEVTSRIRNDSTAASDIGEFVSEVITGDQNKTETSTGVTILPALLQINMSEGTNLETATGIREIISEVITADQQHTETAIGTTIRPIGNILTEMDIKYGGIGEIISEVTTGDKNNLEIATGITIMPFLFQRNRNESTNFDLETATGIEEFVSEQGTDGRSYLEAAIGREEIISRLEVIFGQQNYSQTATDIGKMMSEVTIKAESNSKADIDIGEIVSKVNLGDQNNTENSSSIAGFVPKVITVDRISLETATDIGEIASEMSIGDQNNVKNEISMTIWPVLSQMSPNESTNLETVTGIGEFVSEVTSSDKKHTEATPDTTNNNTDFETLIALRKIESGEIADDERDFKRAKNIQPVSSKMERDDQTDLKSTSNISDKPEQWRGKKYANKKIERKIVDSFEHFSSNCNFYKPIKFSLEHFKPPSAHRIRMGPKTHARVYDFTLKESREDDINWSNYATIINCELDSMKIQASIPTKLTIKARVDLLSPLSRHRVLHKGSVSVTYTGASVWGEFNRNGTYVGPMGAHSSIKELFPNLYFVNSRVTFHSIDKEHHVQVYRAIEKLFKQTKHVHDFFIKELEQKMQENGISYSSSCSNLKNMAPDYNPSIPITNADLSQSYVIPHVKLEPIKGSIVHAGPVIIDGLLNFNSSEFNRYVYDISQEEHSDHSGSNNDIIVEKVYKQITATDLKGKFQWKHHSKKNVLPFSIEQVEFRSFLSSRINLQGRRVNDRTKKSRISVKVGKINIATSHAKFRENEISFANFILSKYLESLIGKSLQKSIEKRFNRVLLHEKCDVLLD